MNKKGVNFSKHSKEYFDSIEDPNKKFWSDISIALIIALTFFVLVFIVPRFFYEVVEIEGSSMEPTVYEETNKVGILKTKNVGFGDIVVIDIKYKGLKNGGKNVDNIIKRVIGLEGDFIEIKNEDGECRVYRNGEVLDEQSYINGKMIYADMQYVVEENCIFVMGDNRNVSKDSRSNEIGQIPVNKILGKAITILTKTSDFLGISWYSTKFI